MQVKTITREYSPGEAGIISGVSPVLQRDWRRRGILPEREGAKYTRFCLEDVIEMTVMRAFSSAGLNLEAAASIASLAVLPVLDDLHRWDDTAVFEGEDLSVEDKQTIRERAVVGAGWEDKFSFVALPENPNGAGAARMRDLSGAEQIMAKNKSFHGLVVDHNGLAHHIAKLSAKPIIRFVIGEAD